MSAELPPQYQGVYLGSGDFQRTLLWLRSLEIVRGETLTLTLSELAMPLFGRYRSPFKA